MAREQPIVARDFMGLGNKGDVTERVEAQGRHHSFPDSDPSTFLGLKDSSVPSKLQEPDVGRLGGPVTASMNSSSLLNSMAFAGIKHSIWSKAAAFQHLLPPSNIHEEKFVEQSAENVPERSYPHLVHPMQAWWRGDALIKGSPRACDFPSNQILGGFGGTLPKNALSFPNPNLNAHAGFSDAIQMRMPGSGPAGKQDAAPLTIFYGGNVNVFNEITAEKAQAIMFLAGGGNMQGSPMDFLASASMPNTTVTNLASKIQVDHQTCCNVESCQAATHQAGYGNVNMQLDFGHPGVPAPSSPGQPAVPKALPQARKASLARFLEKRRERVQSKSPYLLKVDSSLPEERFSSSNDMASYRPYSNIDDKKRSTMSSWMERMHEYSTSDMVVKEDNNVVTT